MCEGHSEVTPGNRAQCSPRRGPSCGRPLSGQALRHVPGSRRDSGCPTPPRRRTGEQPREQAESDRRPSAVTVGCAGCQRWNQWPEAPRFEVEVDVVRGGSRPAPCLSQGACQAAELVHKVADPARARLALALAAVSPAGLGCTGISTGLEVPPSPHQPPREDHVGAWWAGSPHSSRHGRQPFLNDTVTVSSMTAATHCGPNPSPLQRARWFLSPRISVSACQVKVPGLSCLPGTFPVLTLKVPHFGKTSPSQANWEGWSPSSQLSQGQRWPGEGMKDRLGALESP